MENANENELNNIKKMLDDLNIDCSQGAKHEIAEFYLNNKRSTIPVDIMILIISGLSTLHKMAKREDEIGERADFIINFIYTHNKFTLNDLQIIAKSLRVIQKANTISEDTLNNLKNKTQHLGLVRKFLISTEKLRHTNNPETSQVYTQIYTNGIISKGENNITSSGEYSELGFGYHEIKGLRQTQEDALIWKHLSRKKLNSLTSEQIGRRLWTIYRNFDDNQNRYSRAGTTASTTICTDNALITGTLSDTIAYAVIYKENDEIEVHRLNNHIRHADDPSEKRRIKALYGYVVQNRIKGRFKGSLATPRSIGDSDKFPGVCADADIDIFDLTKIPKNYKIQVITACDGFTEPLIYKYNRTDSKLECENFLKYYLQQIERETQTSLKDLDEADIARYLVTKAYNDASEDNISISVQTVRNENFIFNGMVGIYDGHGGARASHYVADNIGKEMDKMLMLKESKYEKLANSVSKNRNDFERDNIDIENIHIEEAPITSKIAK